MAENILVVDDEREIADLVEVYLQNEGYTVYKFYNAGDALNCLETTPISLAVLDIMLPDMDGFALCRRIRQKFYFPIIMLTAKVEDLDKIMGLTVGADDYITKPFSITEVMARIKANIRRNTEYAAVQPEQTKLVWGPLVMNLENHTVTKSGEIIELTAKEFDILRLLLENPQRVYTKAQIYSLIWNDAYMGDENAVNVHISRLRTKIEDDPRKPQVVITVWGIGYKLGEQE